MTSFWGHQDNPFPPYDETGMSQSMRRFEYMEV